MSLPGIGSIVIYHYHYVTGPPVGVDVAIDVPAMVLVTPESWFDTGGPQNLTQPSSDTVILSYLLPGFPENGTPIIADDVSEGTGAGQFSLIGTEAPDNA
jgi:hypothetical protein